jgi:hypothetical protein
MRDGSVAARQDTSVYLDVRLDAYELRLDGEVIARLAGGSAALLPGTGALRDIDIETAIERSEDWLMPVSKLLSGLELQLRMNRDGCARWWVSRRASRRRTWSGVYAGV